MLNLTNKVELTQDVFFGDHFLAKGLKGRIVRQEEQKSCGQSLGVMYWVDFEGVTRPIWGSQLKKVWF